MTNPLLTMKGLPPFSAIKPEHAKPAVEAAIAHCHEVIDQVLASGGPYTWDNFAAPLEAAGDRLSRIWSPVGHMNAVVNNEALREAYNASLPLLSEYSTYVGQHEGLYQAYCELQAGPQFAALTTAQQKSVNDALRDFKLSGIGLDDAKKQRYGEIKKRLSELCSTFSDNLLDATNAWSKHLPDESALAGLPESALALAKDMAAGRDLDGYLLTLDFPSYLPVMSYADNRELRREVYEAFVTRASDKGPYAGKWDNGPLMEEILALRHELALLLGFDNYAELSLATKMAESPEQVIGFLTDLAQRSKTQGEQELAEIRAFAAEQHDMSELEAWDLTYYAEKLKEHKYAINQEQLRPYFPEDRVLSGLFRTVGQLFGVTVSERQGVDSWHESVRFFDIHDGDGELRGSFYLDLYARAQKRGGAWMDDCIGRRRTAEGELQKPVAYLTCNFNKPVGDKPALFTHDEVTTLFHEFGHGIHHMLTQVDVGSVSGINGVPWDAVELPSQFLENWCWEPEALAFISGHYETGEPLPKALLDKMLAARNYQAAMGMLRQLEFGLFDFRLHGEYQPANPRPVQQVLDEVRSQVAVFKAPAFNRFQHSFAHIFAGGYAAGYYSYKWAEVLSADAFSRFEEEGIFNPQTGADFLHHILERGGAEEMMDLFKAFRGREPQIDALLRHCGIAA